MKTTDDLLLHADLQVLWGLQSILADYGKDKEDTELIRILLELEKFVEIHKTRTRDMVTYRDTIDRAREEYRSLNQKYRGTQELLDNTREMLHKVMNEKLDSLDF